MSKLTVRMICREALLLLVKARERQGLSKATYEGEIDGQVQFFAKIKLTIGALDKSLMVFSEHVLRAPVQALSYQALDFKLSSEAMPLPKGLAASAERYDGIALRTIIGLSKAERPIPERTFIEPHYYNILTDEMERNVLVYWALRFDVRALPRG